MTIDLGSAHGKIVIDTQGVQQGVSQATQAIGGLSAASVALGNIMTQALGTAVDLVKKGFMASVGAAMDMEAQMSGIASVMGTTADQVAPLATLITELGVNPTLKVEAAEAAAAIEMLARNGLNMQQILDGAAESTVLLANATGGDFGNAADIMTDAMAIFNIEAANTIDAVNGITSVTTNSKFTIDDYRLALAQGGGVAAQVGVEFADFNTAIAGISSLFASGSDAGTAFKTMLGRLIPASGPAGDAMAELGLITEDGANAFFDASGNLKDMADIAGILQDATADLSEEQKNQALTTIFGSDALRAAAGLANLGEEAFRDLQAQMGQTDAAASAAERMDNLSGVVEIITGLFETFALQIGQALLPFLRDLADWFLIIADTYGPQVVEKIGNIVGSFEQFFLGLQFGQPILDALGGLLLRIGGHILPFTEDSYESFGEAIFTGIELIRSTLQPVVDFINKHVEMQDVLIALGIVVASIVVPALVSMLVTLGTIAAPIVALIAVVALVRKAWTENWGDIQGKTAAAWAVIQPLLAAAWEWLNTNIPVALDFLRARWEEIWPLLDAALRSVWDFVKPNILDPLRAWLDEEGPGAIEFLHEVWVRLWSAIQQHLLDKWTLFKVYLIWTKEWFDDLPEKIEAFKEKWNTTWDAAKATIDRIADPIRAFFSAVRSFADWLKNHVFSFRINLPSLPDWATPGSPLPIHTAWSDFARELNRITITPRVDLSGVALAGVAAAPVAGGATTTITIDARGATDPGGVEAAVQRALLAVGIRADELRRMR